MMGLWGSSHPMTPQPAVVMVFSDLSDEEPEEMIAFDTQPIEGRLPNSSYSQKDTLFTWADITG